MKRNLRLPDRSGVPGRILAFAIIVSLALLPGSATMQDVTDDGEIQVVIYPAGDSTGSNQAPGASAPGTVSAAIANAEPGATSSTPQLAEISLLIRDDRGVASGWDVHFSIDSSAGAPVLISNDPRTVWRIIPPADGSAGQSLRVSSGNYLGATAKPVPLLEAPPDSGAGLFHQRLVLEVEPESPGTIYTITIHLPAAP